MAKTDSYLGEWLVCPNCGYDGFGITDVPQPAPGHNAHLRCPECGEVGTVVG